MKVLIIFATCLAVVLSQDEDCNALQRLKVMQQWASAFGNNNVRESVGEAIFRAIFAQSPKAKGFFERVNVENINSPEFKAHIVRVLGGLDMSISLLADAETLEAQLAHLNDQHKDRKIPNAAFGLFKNALMQVIPAQMGHCFDKEAWSECFNVIAKGITK